MFPESELRRSEIFIILYAAPTGLVHEAATECYKYAAPTGLEKKFFTMTQEKTVRYSTEELRSLETGGGDKTDWNRLRLMKDEDIVYDEDSPEITDNMFPNALISPRSKTEIRLLLDSDVIEWYKKKNIAYQPLINALLYPLRLDFSFFCSENPHIQSRSIFQKKLILIRSYMEAHHNDLLS
ncbi:MAG: hypothetical protein BWK80_07500 [Desulfobacteraceae bacterium IS3]|nr:MAG: hypothetical protein BWK80_07500 [Desulfobacteraceae bacterium IS3]